MADNNNNISEDQDFYGAVRFFGSVTIKSVSGKVTVGDTLTIGGDLIIPALSKLYLDGGDNTYITEGTADTTQFYNSGALCLELDTSGLQIGNTSTNKAKLRNISTSATSPNILPSGADVDTGIGLAGVNRLSLIAGGKECARVYGYGIQQLSPQQVTANNTTSGQIDSGSGRVVVAGVTNDANDWVLLPAGLTGMDVWVYARAGSNFEIRTQSGEKINNVVCDGTQEYLATDTDIIHFHCHTTGEWIGVSYTVLGAVRTAVVPD